MTTNIDWLDNFIDKHPILLKDFINEIENLHSISEDGVLETKTILEILQKQVAKLEKEATSFKRKEIVTKVCKEAVPKQGDGYKATPLWRLEIESILNHLTIYSIEYEKVSSELAIHRLNDKVITLIERKIRNYSESIQQKIQLELTSNDLLSPEVKIKKINARTVVALNQKAENFTEYLSTISSGVKKPIYAIFSVSLLCMLFFGGSIFTMASDFFSNHSSYLYICLTVIALSVYKALELNKHSKLETEKKEKEKSLGELRKNTLHKMNAYISKHIVNEKQILEYNNILTRDLIRAIRTEIRGA